MQWWLVFELLFACKKCAQVLKTDAGTYLGISQNLLVLDSSQISDVEGIF